MEPIKKTNRVNNFFRSNVKKITGAAASEKEIEMLKNSLPSLGKGVISNIDLDFIKKLIPNKN
jgi:hypothetical protein